MSEEMIKIGAKATENVVCANCQKTVTGSEALSFRGKKGEDVYICSTCKQQVDTAYRHETENPNLFGATALGIVAGIVAGVVWYVVEILTSYRIGYIALGAGYLIGLAVVWGSGKKRGTILQLISVSITLLSIWCASYFAELYYINKAIAQEASQQGEQLVSYLWVSPFHPELLKMMISPIGLLIWGIALYIASNIPRVRKLA